MIFEQFSQGGCFFEGLLPISTNGSTTSSKIRRPMAVSRVGAIRARMFASRRAELAVIIFLAVSILIFGGSTSDGQAFFGGWLKDYIEEKGLSLSVNNDASSLQLASIGGFSTGSGGDSATAPIVLSSELPVVGESALLGMTPPLPDYLDTIAGKRSKIISYTVQEGDLISFIASDYGVSVNSILWANNLANPDSIKLGQILRIPPVNGVIHTVKSGDTVTSLAKRYDVSADQIITYNRLPLDGGLRSGEEVIVPGGVKMAESVVQARLAVNYDETGTPQVPLIGTASPSVLAQYASLFEHLPDLDGYFITPAAGYNWGRVHGRNGVDIANSCGTPIVAAADGVVSIADGSGWNGGFGGYIKITHPNGVETLYAHASRLVVQTGQAVGKGQKIALIGATGNATGCHLHFEVHGAQNPLAR